MSDLKYISYLSAHIERSFLRVPDENMFNILSNIKGALQTGVEKVTKTIQNQIGDLLEEQKQLAEAEELDQQSNNPLWLKWK